MLLVIDSGNTQVVFGLYQGGKKLGQWRLRNEPQRSGDEYIAYLNQWASLGGFVLDDIKDVIISSVVPEALFHLKDMAGRYFGKAPFVIGELELNLGIAIKIDNPQSLGADRLVNTFGGYRRYGGPLIIIDFGTATTFDVVDDEGSYIGGIIAPGVHLSLKALYEAAAKLPPIIFERTEHVIGTKTTTAMKAGCYWGYVGMIEGLSARIRQEYLSSHKPTEMTLIATGGLARIFSQDLSLIHHVNEDLTLDSLAEIYYLLLS